MTVRQLIPEGLAQLAPRPELGVPLGGLDTSAVGISLHFPSVSTVDRPPVPYEQVAMHVRSKIQRGRLVAGTGLPSVPRLAQQWDVFPATVGRALGLLWGEGWIVTRPSKPAVVTESPPGGMDWFAPSGL